METNRLPKGHVYSGRGDVIDMDQIVAKSRKTVRERASEVTPISVPTQAAKTKLRGNRVSGQPRPIVYSANTPEGLEPTLAELTGVRIDRLKHIKVVRPPTPEEVEGLVQTNVNSVLSALTPESKNSGPKRGGRPRKTEADRLEDEINS